MKDELELGIITYQTPDGDLKTRRFEKMSTVEITVDGLKSIKDGLEEKEWIIKEVHSFLYLGNEFFKNDRFVFLVDKEIIKHTYFDSYKDGKFNFKNHNKNHNESNKEDNLSFSSFDSFITGKLEYSLQNLIKKYEFKPSSDQDLSKFKERYRNMIINQGTHMEDLLYTTIGNWLVVVPKHCNPSCYYIYYYNKKESRFFYQSIDIESIKGEISINI